MPLPDTPKAKRPPSRQLHSQQTMWDHIRQVGQFTADDLITHTGAHRWSATAYIERLSQGGYIVRGPRWETHGEWMLAPKGGEEAPVLRADGTLIQDGREPVNMWRAMRLLKTFTPRDLSAHCTTPDVSVSEKAAREYCATLLEHGFLRVVKKATRIAPATYRLVKDSGAHAPQVRLVKCIWDPNTRSLHAPTTVAEKAR